jgi:hypothetical protein
MPANTERRCFLSSLLAWASESARRPTQPPMRMCARSVRRSRLHSQPMTFHLLRMVNKKRPRCWDQAGHSFLRFRARKLAR